MRGELNDRRKQIVLQAFQVLDADKSGLIELNDITARYSAAKHPDVISGKRTSAEVLTEFLDTFSVSKTGKITPEDFVQYYANVSSSIDDDDYFELVIRNAWHISGGSGWCANTSNRRVLVTHKDGKQTVEEVKNDIGIGADDKDKILENLAAQGIDVASIDLKGSAADSASTVTPAAAAAAAGKVPPASPDRRAAGGRPNNLSGESRPASAATSYNPGRQPGGKSSIIFG